MERNVVKEFRGKWENLFPKNRTQTMYLRFLKTPKADVKTSYIKQMEESLDKNKNKLTTRYTEFMEKIL